ncbi:uncharacterized protein YcfL [Litorivivens lipolytica]|uniref:Uncharacterized protein YcfL n=1 Tax=Litorivivens lipolytica TaxID=1524264 RepID=A0A7W4W7F2_9GAMM|nr:DUF1425 domain-containing protein [Litorivivens lipolytica]MBB3048878.1 uncharacterized protein YcfL [Litorivivens lipolytica]
MKRIVLLIISALFVTACASPVTSNRQMSHANEPWAAHVNYGGKGLQIVDVRSWYSSDKGMKVMLSAKSTALMDLKLNYRVLWYTADGQPIKTLLGKWQERLVKPGQLIELTSVSPGPRAADYRIEIQEINKWGYNQ